MNLRCKERANPTHHFYLSFGILVLLFFSSSVCAQRRISGSIIDKDNSSEVSFANVGLIKKNTGTTSNEHGRFVLQIDEKHTDDTLIIWNLNYESLKIPIGSITEHPISVKLKRKVQMLSEFNYVASKSTHVKSLNDFGDSTSVYQSTTTQHIQLAQLVRSPWPAQQLTKVRFLTAGPIFPVKKGLVRIRVYSVDSASGLPGADLCQKSIEVNTKNKRLVEVDLEPYDIKIPHSTFFIAIEWLKVPENRINSSYTQSESEQSYGPCIGLAMGDSSGDALAWLQNHNGSWEQIGKLNSRLSKYNVAMISATVRQ
jgi:hypothetical protein